jgi:hypothetical protein
VFLVGGIGVPMYLYEIRLLIRDNCFMQVEGVLTIWPTRGRGFHSVRERLDADALTAGVKVSNGKGVWALMVRIERK